MNDIKKIIVITISVSFIFSLFTADTEALGNVKANAAIKKYIGQNGSALLADPTGNIIYSLNPDKKLIPASTLKILTSLVAIHYLNEDFRFKTEFYQNNASDLLIKGYGDPLLISEEIQTIARDISSRVQKINSIILDDTYFTKPIIISGTVKGSLQPYDAPNGALCANFNTVNYKIINNQIVSAEPQTPMVTIARKRIRSLKQQSGRILLTNNEDEITLYTGELFSYFLRQYDMEIGGDIKLGIISPEKNHLVYRHSSPFCLTEVIQKLLEFSNNYVANQLLLAAGASKFGPPATIEKGVKAAKEYASAIGIDEINIVEGSGISRNNRISAHSMLKLLIEFKPYYKLLQYEKQEYYKTGTLNGINTKAGFILNNKGELCPFMVMINTPEKSTSPVVKELKKLVD
jgi:D-alanyl-D-alanine carboxypeptidase/D-alanyl-D-alanine-endopeptidase (penicillin-binding protein 4)